MYNVEFIIVGQGISGTFLSWYLHKAQRSFVVIDNDAANTPSKIAAGIINPVTGRRMVTVWMAEKVIPFAKQAYDEIGNELGITAISQKNIIDLFPNPFMRESFLKRIDENNAYIRLIEEEDQFQSFFQYEFGCGEIKPVYTAHLETLLPAWRQWLHTHDHLREEEFSMADLQMEADKVRYKDITARKILFCDGVAGAEHPWFKSLPFAPNKGEALIVEVQGLPNDYLFKKSLLLAPLEQKDIFWIGSNYIWDFDNTDPTPAFREATEKILQSWLKLPFKILEHRAGVRPATIERRPFVGMHPVHRDAGILNGMGTKGCSLAPFFAKQLTDHLVHGKPIHGEADVQRFARVLSRP